MKRVKCFLAVFLCLCSLTAMLATSASAATVLTIIRVSIDQPTVGERPATNASLPSNARSAIRGVKWDGKLDANGCFKEGEAYTLTVTLGIKSGADCVFSSKKINATVNGDAADEVLWYAKDHVEVIYHYEASTASSVGSGSSRSSGKKTVIDTIYITVDKPAAGAMPASSAKLSAGSNGVVNSVVREVKWSGQMDSNGTFLPGGKYTVTFVMGLKDASTCAFSDKSIKATVNGKTADDVLWYSSDHVEVIYTFPALSGSSGGGVASKATLTLDVPTVGQRPATRARMAETGDIYVKGVRWEGPLDSNGCFLPGTEYTAYITLGVTDKGLTFSDRSFDAEVNGYLIDEVTRVSDTELIVPVEFEKTPGSAPAQSLNPGFTDVAASSPFAKPIAWAVEKGITNGTSKTTFSPGNTCSQAQILTFLWRAKGSPEPGSSVIMEGFTGSEYYYKAAMWAAESGMVEGNFDPNAPCTRAMAVTFLWKQAGSPATTTSASFSDVNASAAYAPAVSWAVEKGVTNGTGANAFSPSNPCTRGQIATFLYRAFAS